MINLGPITPCRYCGRAYREPHPGGWEAQPVSGLLVKREPQTPERWDHPRWTCGHDAGWTCPKCPPETRCAVCGCEGELC